MSVDVIFRKSIDTFTVNIYGFNNIAYKEVFNVPVKRIQKWWCVRIFPGAKSLRVDLGYKGLEPTTASYQIIVFNGANRLSKQTSSIERFMPGLDGDNYFFPTRLALCKFWHQD